MNKCQVCKQYFNDRNTYEYRGFMFCEEHFDEGVEKVVFKRNETMEVLNKSIESQRKGEFANNHRKYDLNNLAEDGLPIIKAKEPLIEQEYRDRIL